MLLSLPKQYSETRIEQKFNRWTAEQIDGRRRTDKRTDRSQDRISKGIALGNVRYMTLIIDQKLYGSGP